MWYRLLIGLSVVSCASPSIDDSVLDEHLDCQASPRWCQALRHDFAQVMSTHWSLSQPWQVHIKDYQVKTEVATYYQSPRQGRVESSVLLTVDRGEDTIYQQRISEDNIYIINTYETVAHSPKQETVLKLCDQALRQSIMRELSLILGGQ